MRLFYTGVNGVCLRGRSFCANMKDLCSEILLEGMLFVELVTWQCQMIL